MFEFSSVKIHNSAIYAWILMKQNSINRPNLVLSKVFLIKFDQTKRSVPNHGKTRWRRKMARRHGTRSGLEEGENRRWKPTLLRQVRVVRDFSAPEFGGHGALPAPEGRLLRLDLQIAICKINELHQLEGGNTGSGFSLLRFCKRENIFNWPKQPIFYLGKVLPSNYVFAAH